MNPKPPDRKKILEQELAIHATRFEVFIFKQRRLLAFGSFLICFAIVFVLGVLTRPDLHGWHSPGHIGDARQIALLLLSYAKDHGGHFPEGKSSTAVFQHLLDEDYIHDPTFFYIEMPGKSRPTSNQLKPENVSWDFTGGASPKDSETLPLVFSTGFQIDYSSGSILQRTPLNNDPFSGFGMAAALVNANAMFVRIRRDAVPSHFPLNFDTKGKTYRQLTPDGPIPR